MLDYDAISLYSVFTLAFLWYFREECSPVARYYAVRWGYKPITTVDV